MPRYFCDYCQTYLTHDSPSGRQQHMRGKQHRDRFKAWFEPIYIEWARSNPQSSSYSGNYGAGQPPMMHQHPPGYPQQSNPYGNYGVPPMGLPPPMGTPGLPAMPSMGFAGPPPMGFVPPPQFRAPPPQPK